MFSIKASEMVGPQGIVVAVEPSPETFMLLKKNVESCPNIHLAKYAIMDKEGTEKLYYSKAAAANSLILKRSDRYVEVSAITLDQLMDKLHLSRADFIKIDAEGAELNVLKGATETLRKGTRLVIAAYHTTENGEQEIGKVEEYLYSAGYTTQYAKGLRSYISAEKSI